MRHGWLILIGVGAYWLYNRMNQPVIEMPLQQPAPIPQSTVQPPASGPRFVEVGQGDTMAKIASAYGLSLADMAKLNPDFGPKGKRSMDLIFPGEQLRVA